jgi:hypothetical protein
MLLGTRLGFTTACPGAFLEQLATILLPNSVARGRISRDEVIPLCRIVPIIQYFVIQAGTEQYGGKRISSAVLLIKPRTCKCLVGPQPSMPGPFRQIYLDVKGEQSIEQLRLAIKMMLAVPAARNLSAAVLE